MNQTKAGLYALAVLSLLSCGTEQGKSNATTVELPPASATMAVDSSSEFKTGTPADAVGKGWIYRTEYGEGRQNDYLATTTGLMSPLLDDSGVDVSTAQLTIRRKDGTTDVLLHIDEGYFAFNRNDLTSIRARVDDGVFVSYLAEPKESALQNTVNLRGTIGLINRLYYTEIA